MRTIAEPDARAGHHGFHHEAFLYRGEGEFLEGAVPFVEEGLAAGEPVMVAIGAPRIALLREALGAGAERVRFADMAELGANPARIMAAWRAFAAERPAPGHPLRGIGEPIWAGRSEAEIAECERHESLLNLAFAETPAFRLMCPYDAEALPEAVIEGACGNHPVLASDGGRRASDLYAGLEGVRAPFDRPLPAPPAGARRFAFVAGSLTAVRAMVARQAAEAGIEPVRAQDWAVAVNEVATNSVRHGGGAGVVRTWQEPVALLCEVRDRGGPIADPLVGREVPAGDDSGWGLWLANQLCELVQIRSGLAGTVVRLHLRLA